MDEERRTLVKAGAALGATHLLGAAGPQAQAAAPRSGAMHEVDRIPAIPAQPSPGTPGQFDFLSGSWRIHHWRRAARADAWDEFDGEASCWSILGGIASIEELRIPARQFSGMGLRLLDVEKRAWSDFWVNARSGALGTPGMPGSFEQGAGVFFADERDERGDYRVVSLWDQITPASCRWRQAVSRDAGRSWEVNWVMAWQRA